MSTEDFTIMLLLLEAQSSLATDRRSRVQIGTVSVFISMGRGCRRW